MYALVNSIAGVDHDVEPEVADGFMLALLAKTGQLLLDCVVGHETPRLFDKCRVLVHYLSREVDQDGAAGVLGSPGDTSVGLGLRVH